MIDSKASRAFKISLKLSFTNIPKPSKCKARVSMRDNNRGQLLHIVDSTGELVCLGETEFQDNQNPIFKTEIATEYMISSLCDIVVEAVSDENVVLAKCSFNLNKLVVSLEKVITIRFEHSSSSVLLGFKEVKDCQDSAEMSIYDKFFAYLNGGLTFDGSLVIDFFSAPDRKINPRSNHQIERDKYNLFSVGIIYSSKILLDLDEDKIITPIGFGAKVPITEGAKDPGFIRMRDPSKKPPYDMNYLESLYIDYAKKVEKVEECNLGPFLARAEQIIMKAASKDPYKYFVFIIFTEGELSDYEDVKDIIVRMSNLPVSIIFIGIGDGDFNKFINLDADDSLLYDRNSIRASRDLVQFVNLTDYLGQDTFLLLTKLFEELPTQIVKYLERKGIPPREAQDLTEERIKEIRFIESFVREIENEEYINNKV